MEFSQKQKAELYTKVKEFSETDLTLAEEVKKDQTVNKVRNRGNPIEQN